MDQKALFYIVSSYRSPNKNEKDEPKGRNYKKGDFKWGIPYNINAEGLVMSVLLEDKFIIPSGLVQILNDQQTAEHLAKEKSTGADAETIVTENEEKIPSVEKLNDEGRSIMAESTEKIKKMSFDVSKKLQNNYTKIGVGVGAVAGIGLSLYLRKGFVLSALITIGSTAFFGFLGSKIKKNDDAIKTK